MDVREVALSNKNTTTELRITGMAGGLGLHSLTADTDGETITVKTRKGDSLVTNGEAVPSVIKIDVEGAEGNVLEGLSDVLSHPACRVVYCEIHASESLPNSVQDFDHTPETVENKLQEAGFVLELVSDGDAYMLKGTRTTQPLDCIDL